MIKELRRIWSWYAPERKVELASSTEWHPVTKYSKLSNAYQVKEKFHRCKGCRGLFKPNEVQVDHKVQVGIFPEWPPDPTKNDWNVYLAKLFCPRDNLQTLCSVCHKVKSEADRKERKDV